MERKYKLFELISEKIGHPLVIAFFTIVQILLFFMWVFTGLKTLFYEVFHIILAIMTLLIALIIESSEKTDSKEIKRKLEEVNKKLTNLDSRISSKK